MEIHIDPHTLERAEERVIQMIINYNDKSDLLYIRLDDKKQQVINKKISENMVLDIGENDKIVGIEILDASQH